MTSMYVVVLLLLAAATHAAPAPWLVVAPSPSHVVDNDNTQADESHYYELKFNALDYATSDMRQRGATYLDGLRRSLEDLLEPDRAASAAGCDVIAVDSASTIASAASESNDTKTADARERARACEARTRAATSVRGAAALALHTARLLGDGRGALDPRREHQLIVRLARLLDSLATTVGFSYTNKPTPTPTQSKDNPRPGAESSTAAATTEPTLRSPHYANASSELVQEMIVCLDQSPTDPRASYLRCPPSATPQARRRRDAGGLRKMEDPSQDLSDVSKALQGGTITNDQAGAAATRAQLEVHFQNPGLERARRYGSNYQGNNLAITSFVRMLADA